MRASNSRTYATIVDERCGTVISYVDGSTYVAAGSTPPTVPRGLRSPGGTITETTADDGDVELEKDVAAHRYAAGTRRKSGTVPRPPDSSI